jgi:hypothetical protein
MTIIAFHNGAMYADDQARIPSGNFAVAVPGKKILVSKCQRFAYAVSGTIPVGDKANWMETYLLKHLMDYHGDKDLMIPAGIGSEGYAKPISDNMIIMTQDGAWTITVNGPEKNLILLPALCEVPFCLGTGQDVVMALWALGWTVEKAVHRVHHYVPTCSGNITKVTMRSLKPFKIVGVKRG